MDFTEQFKNWILTILAGGISVNAVISGINLIKSIFGGMKVSKLLNFTAVAENTVKDNQNVFAELKKQFNTNASEFMADIKTNFFEPMKKEVESLKTDNVMLANIVVTTLSLVNVPIEQKNQLFNSLCKISSVADETKKLLSASIESQQAQETAEKQDNSVIIQNISNS